MSVPSSVPEGKVYPNIDYYFIAPEEKAYDATPDSGIHELGITDPEQRVKLEDDWKNELIKTEEEIATLRQVLSAKVKHAQDLKRKLGITPWKELKDDMEQTLKNIQETPAYQKTSQTLKAATEKPTSVLGTLGASMTKKLGEVKNSSTFQSFEEKIGYAYTNVRSKMVTPRSTSLYNFGEAANSSERRGTVSAATTPIIPESGSLP